MTSKTLSQCIQVWNEQADGYNQWNELDADERCEWCIKFVMDQWQPIETAPMDERIILHRPTSPYDAGCIIIGRYETNEYAINPKPYWRHDLERLFGIREAREHSPTHWMPRPDPPKQDA